MPHILRWSRLKTSLTVVMARWPVGAKAQSQCNFRPSLQIPCKLSIPVIFRFGANKVDFTWF